jgi:hypothetical protein
MPFILHSFAVLVDGKIIRFQSDKNFSSEETLMPVVADPDPPLGLNERLCGPDYEILADHVRAYGKPIPMTPEEIADRNAANPQVITRRQCALQLLALALITHDEALAMTKFGDTPSAITAIFDQQLAEKHWTTEQRTLAEIDFAAANYYRSNSLLSLMGLTDEQIDRFFILAATL